jgi:crotonobetainyl-CoA:carnitine CoA-transferase CaiB-like acyl-CoA transferase
VPAVDKSIFKNFTVLTLEQATVAPYLTYRLAQDGMKVIRVENPAMPDPNRYVGENRLNEEGMYTYFLAINAGKKAITLNLAEEKGREILEELIVGLNVDIFITNQLPRNYEKLGIGYNVLSAAKKDLIWVGITGFGPDSNEAAYDPILQARGGLMDLTGEKDGNPVVTGIPLPDMGTSEHAYGLIMKGLLHRALTGEGSRIDMCMFESTVSWLTVPVCLTKSFGNLVTRRGNTHEFFAPVSVYRTRDSYVYVAVGNDRQWESVTAIPAFSHLAREDYKRNAGRIADVDNLNQAINEVTANFSTDEVISLFQEAKVAISRVNTIDEVLEEPIVQNNILFSRDEKSNTELTLAPPPNMTSFLKEEGRYLSFPPRLGEHNEEIYHEALKMSPDDLEKLREAKII